MQIVKNIRKNFFRRQDAPQTYDMNASIYIWKRNTLVNTDIRTSPPSLKKGRAVFYEMPTNRSIDIDSET